MQSVQRALSILSLFTKELPALHGADDQRARGPQPSPASRLRATLEAPGYVAKAPATGQYRLGAEIIRLGGVALSDSGLRRRGYAVEREELAVGLACIAAPIRDRTRRVVAAISLSGPLSAIQLEACEPALARDVIECADHVSAKLGYIPTPASAGYGLFVAGGQLPAEDLPLYQSSGAQAHRQRKERKQR
jgi:DNA-binding IclR family transcriptional regulator